MKQVIKWESDDGSIHDTEAAAKEADQRQAITKEFECDRYYNGVSSKVVVDWFFDRFELKEKKK
jgi:hypothetical protein